MKELKKSLQDNDLDDVFIIPKDFDANGIPTSNECVDILDTIFGITIEQVTTASALYALKSSATWHPQNVAWSGKKILASCEDDLKEKVIEAAEKIPKEKRGGPVYLFLMSKLILATSEKAMRGLTDKISSLTLSNFDGENVLTAGSYLKAAMNLFRAHDKVPKDITLLIFKIFRESSTTEFNNYLTSIESNLDTAPLFGKEVTMTPEDILDAFEVKYTNILGRGEWEAKSTTNGQESAFNANASLADLMCLAIARVINKTGVSPHIDKTIDTHLKFHREIHPDDPSSKAIRSAFRSIVVSPAQKPHIQQLDCPNGSQVLFQDLSVCHHGQTSLKSVLAPRKGRLPETFQVSTFLDSL